MDAKQMITGKQQLIDYFGRFEKPENQWRIGTEHEKFLFGLETHKPLKFDGSCGIEAVLKGLTKFGWAEVKEGPHTIALKRNNASITLEPGGQFELSGAPLQNLHQSRDEVAQHIREVKAVAEELNVGLLGIGFAPEWTREDINWMPKDRYKIMRAYMPKRGVLGLDMMTRTTTTQVNLDYVSEADMVQKLRIGFALSPIVGALFSNSPFKEGRPNGYLSYRNQVWEHTDPDRCAMPDFIFEDIAGYEAYVDYALGVPMYFIYRDGIYHDVTGASFRDFMLGKVMGFEGVYAHIEDWELHLSTIFTDVRLKQFLEFRSADSGRCPPVCALPALWVGLLYDQQNVGALSLMIKDWSYEDVGGLRHENSRVGLDMHFKGKSLWKWGDEIVGLAHKALVKRNLKDAEGYSESRYLEPILEVLQTRETNAERLLKKYNNEWGHSIAPIYLEESF